MTRSKNSKKQSSDASQAPAAEVTSQLEAIDTSPLEQLVETRSDQTRLEEYLAKAEERREKVSAEVWTQVVEDYRGRAKKLADAASPLEQQVRQEYAKLRTLRDAIEQTAADARFQKDEAEFRHELGELSTEDLSKRLARPEKQLAQCEADLTAVDELKARFLEAFPTEEALALPASDATPLQADATIVSTEAAAEPEPEATPAETPGDGQTPVNLQKTQPPSQTRVFNPADLVKKAEPDAEEDDGRTFLLPAAALLVTADGEDSATEYRLASLNYIGRAEENQLRMAQPGVSRKHALVCATDRGYMIQDLDSQNGTFVNGSKVTEHNLSDGDEIAIGNVHLVFRTPWPEPSGAQRGS